MLWRIVFEHDGGEYAVTERGETSQHAMAAVRGIYGNDIQFLSVRECEGNDMDDEWEGWEDVDDGSHYADDDEWYEVE